MSTSVPSTETSPTETSPLYGRSAVITGGGRGIGAATARQLAAAGASVILAARSGDEIASLAEELTAAGHRAWGVVTDVTDTDSVNELLRRAEEHVGRVDILVNNAGIAASAPLRSISLDQWNRIFAVNVTGTFLCTQAFVPAMVENSWGRVVNIASVAGKMGAPYIAAYAASKHAVVGFTRAVALEVARQGVTVNAVCPGYVETDMTDQTIGTITGKTRLDEEQARASLEAMSPQKRIFRAEEVAYQVVSLCDSRAAGINAQCIILDGGTVQA